jgi:hypothetical protein
MFCASLRQKLFVFSEFSAVKNHFGENPCSSAYSGVAATRLYAVSIRI